MTVVLASNFLTHHQLPLCRAFSDLPDVRLTFIATTPIEAERTQMGYSDMNRAHAFVLCAYEGEAEEREARRLCRECDILILGSAPHHYTEGRNGKVTFFYSERLFKETRVTWKTHLRFLKYRMRRKAFNGAYLLCASAFAAQDYARTGSFAGFAYKWGYFPEVRHYDIDALMAQKCGTELRLLWVGRIIGWKHPEAVIEVVRRLKENHHAFRLDLIGRGERESELRSMIAAYGLEDHVHLLGSMSPEEVREYMERANLFLFTSDQNEGWGAVLNEAMNSGCAVVAADGIGAVPYLLKDGENGLIFRSEDWDGLYEKVKRLLDGSALRERLGRAAYRTMAETWNAEVAAQRLLRLADCLRLGEDTPFADGPCSRA